MQNHPVPAAAEGMPTTTILIHAMDKFSRLSQTDRAFNLKVVEMFEAREDPSRLIISRLGAEAAAPILARMVAVSGTTSEQVNALFTRYVAIEKEQHYALDNDLHADDLGAVALAVRDLVFELRDRTGNADLIAARIMLDIMIHEPWNNMGTFKWSDESRDLLDTLECVASSTTGTVRQEARKALATIGIEIDEVDPFLSRMEAYAAELQAFNATGGVEGETPPYSKLLDEIEAGTVKVVSAAGAVVALHRLLDLDCIDDGEGLAMVDAALAYLEGRAI